MFMLASGAMHAGLPIGDHACCSQAAAYLCIPACWPL